MSYYQSLMGTAAHLAALGVRIFPCEPGAKSPKQGVLWKQAATNRVADLPVLFSPVRDYGLAVLLGPSSGIMDCEPDSPEAAALLEQFVQQAGVRTVAYQASRGNHYWFRWDPDLTVFNSAVIKVQALECRLGLQDDAVYSVCPPSKHPSGAFYTWLPGCAPWETQVAEIPVPLKQWFLNNYRRAASGKKISVVSVSKDEDGFLPDVGGRHDYLLRLSKLLVQDMGVPKNLAIEMLRPVAERIGTMAEPGRGELEITNAVNGLVRSAGPEEEFRQLDFTEAYRAARAMREQQRAADDFRLPPEIPRHVFPTIVQDASELAKACQYPRNLFLMTTLNMTASLLGASVTVQATPFDARPSGLQLYTFGVGPSGSGKSRTIQLLTGPLDGEERLLTDATPEAFTQGMAEFPRGSVIVLTEGKDFLSMFGRYQAQRPMEGPNTSLWLRAWSGDTIISRRKSGNTVVPNPFATIIGAIQNINLNQIPGIDLLDGLVQRLLLFPLGRVPEDVEQAQQKAFGEYLARWRAAAARLKSVRECIHSTETLSLAAAAGAPTAPTRMILEPSAYNRWHSYAKHKRSEAYLSQWQEEHPWRSDALRHAEQVLRISAALQWLEAAFEPAWWADGSLRNLPGMQLQDTWVARAIDLVEWLWLHKQNYLDAKVDDAFHKLAGPVSGTSQAVADQLQAIAAIRSRRLFLKQMPTWTVREYYRLFNLNHSKAMLEIELFERQGWVVREGDQEPVRYRFQVSFERPKD